MGSTAQAWAMNEGAAQTAVERLVLYRLGGLCGDADPAAGVHTYDPTFTLDDLERAALSSTQQVREALNSLARRGVLTNIQHDPETGVYGCRLNVVFPPNHRW